MTGIGGDMFAIVWIAKEHRLVALNASGRAGALMTREELVKRGRSSMPRAASRRSRCPARSPDGMRCSKKYGTISLAQALQPAIRYAEEGLSGHADHRRATGRTRRRCSRATQRRRRRSCRTATRRRRANGSEIRTTRARFARSRKDGIEALYGGALGQRIVARRRSSAASSRSRISRRTSRRG